MPEEARGLLATAATREDRLEPLRNATLEEAIEAKMQLVRGARLAVSVGGSEGNLGRAPDALELHPGLIMPRSGGGDGVIGRALRDGYPVIHLLNLRRLASVCGVAWGARRPFFFTGGNVLVGMIGLTLFILFMATHKRWDWARNGDSGEGG